MSGPKFNVQASPNVQHPLDDRMSVANIAELFNIAPETRWDNMRVFVRDTQIAYYFRRGHNSPQWIDNLNWLTEAEYLELWIIHPPSQPEFLVRKYEVTADFAANELITITDGAGSITGLSTPTNDTVNTLGVSAAEFNDNNLRQIRLIGIGIVTKGVYAIWDAPTVFHFSVPLSIGDRFEVIVEFDN